MSLRNLSHGEWLAQFNAYLTNERFASGTMKYYVPRVSEFLAFLQKRHIELDSVRPTHVDRYLQLVLRRLRRRYGRLPFNWRSGYTNPIGAFLKFAHGQWPPNQKPVTQAERLQHQLCEQYVRWMIDVRGLAPATISERRKEACRFLTWLRTNRLGLAALKVDHVDRYLKERAHGWRRSSIKAATDWLRIFLRWLHSIGQTNRDLSTAVIGPSMYAFASIPSALRFEDTKEILAAARRDATAKGIRDHAILMLLSLYGMRAGEIVALRLDDIDWRKEVIRLHHAKTGATSYLPLMPEVGNAILKYLQKARPKTSFRQIFIRTRAPYRPFPTGAGLYNIVRKRLDTAGVVTSGRRGPHAFRHTRAVSMLRARVPLKEIGDVLGHRSVTSTMIYLKLAVDDLRAIALEIPTEVRA
jgi:site-specific recombinase XerD